MSDNSSSSSGPERQKQAKQRQLLRILSCMLLLGGLAVLFLLKRMPFPLRLFVGAGDVVAASALLLVARQK